MAKVKATKLNSFFEGHRRKAFLNAWSHLRTKAGESRVKFDLRIPLLNESVVGMGGAIGEAFGVMAKDESKIDRTSLNLECEGMTLDIFATGESKRRTVTSTGVKLQKFALVSSGEEEKRQLDLHLVAYTPASIVLRDWAWGHLHGEFYLEAVYSQTEMDFGDGETDDDDAGALDPDEEEDGPKSTPAAKKAAAKPQKNGPKQLAAFHADQKPN
jgi:hypothetical protein